MPVISKRNIRYVLDIQCYNSASKTFFQGLIFASLGPLLAELAHLVHTSIGLISVLMSGRSAGMMLGSLLVGLVLKSRGWWLLSGVCVGLLAITLTLVPWCETLALLMLNYALQGWLSAYVQTSKSYKIAEQHCTVEFRYTYHSRFHFSFGILEFRYILALRNRDFKFVRYIVVFTGIHSSRFIIIGFRIIQKSGLIIS